mmetsp:Transcript_152428/g.265698  ORF Transcript_152428/g.265698 Transcript_152428/m.265698 type:complete len:149 (+) Transcript_152428:105-551(+)
MVEYANLLDQITVYIGILDGLLMFFSGMFAFIKRKLHAPVLVGMFLMVFMYVFLGLTYMSRWYWIPVAVYVFLLFIIYIKKFTAEADPQTTAGELLDILKEAKDYLMSEGDEVLIRERLRIMFGFILQVHLVLFVLSIFCFMKSKDEE